MEARGELWAWQAGGCNGGMDMATKKYKKEEAEDHFSRHFNPLGAFLGEREG